MNKIVLLFVVFLFSFSLVSAISVNDVELADLGFTGFVVEANLDVGGSAQVLYGKTGALGSASSLVSFSKEHLLQVDGLESGTVYFYRVVGKDSQGNSYSSAISLTRTPTNTNFGVSGFYLNSGTSGSKIRDLSDGEILDLSALPSNAYVAVETYGNTQSVVFSHNGAYHNTENSFPWTFFDGFKDLPVGTHTITAKSYNVDGVIGSAVNNGAEGVSKSITFTVTGSKPVVTSDLSFAVIGDSMSNAYSDWPDYFIKKMGLERNDVGVYGVGGATCTKVKDQLLQVASNTDVLFVTCGVNGLYGVNNIAAYEAIYQEAKSKGIGTIFMTTMPPWNLINTRTSSQATSWCNKMKADNTWLKNFAASHNDVHIVDLWTLWHDTSNTELTDCGWRKDVALQNDGVHPNAAGYAQWGNLYYNAVSAWMSSGQPASADKGPDTNTENYVTLNSPSPPSGSPATLASYGAKGDGVTDDSAAIQNAFNNEKYIVGEAGKTYYITKTLFLNKNMAQYIDFKGSTLTSKGHGNFMIDIDKRNYANSLTTIKNLNMDGKNRNIIGIDIVGRVHFENIEIYDMVRNFALGVRILTFDGPGVYGQSVFNNVNIRNLRTATNDGVVGNNAGSTYGWMLSVSETPSKTTQIVYVNSVLSEFWGEDANAILVNSPGKDTSNSPFSVWFENIHIKDAQRRAVKGYMGGTTWINSRFTSAKKDNPNLALSTKAGRVPVSLYSLGASSSATGATNNLFCGVIFEGHPDDPFDSWDTRFSLWGLNGPTGMELRNSEIRGGHGGRHGWNGISFGRHIGDVTIANTKIGTKNTLRTTWIQSQGTVILDTNNVYVDGKSAVLNNPDDPFKLTYIEKNLPYEPCPTIE